MIDVINKRKPAQKRTPAMFFSARYRRKDAQIFLIVRCIVFTFNDLSTAPEFKTNRIRRENTSRLSR